MEEWREIKGFKNYKVSDEGRVKSSRGVLKHDTSGGYHRVTLSISGTTYRFLVHRLVAEAFINNHKSKPMINHIDGDKNNNAATNLEWVTCQENTVHAFSNNLRKSTEDHANATRTNEQIHKVCSLIQSGLKRGDVLALCPSVSKACFDDIRARKTWVRISKHYKW